MTFVNVAQTVKLTQTYPRLINAASKKPLGRQWETLIKLVTYYGLPHNI